MSLWLACSAALCLKPSAWLTQKARRDLGWLPAVCHQRALAGFTLAELLICIAILGVIATFTIPKIIGSFQNGQYNAEMKEAASIITDALKKAQMDGVISASSKASDLTPYINYISRDTVSVLDAHPNWGGDNGTGGIFWSFPIHTCLRLHNGGTLILLDNWTFGGTSSLNAVLIGFDPDSKATGDTLQTSTGKGMFFTLYYTGQVTSTGQQKTGTCNSGGCGNNPGPYDPSWLSW